jgi:hypothetical protein
VHVLRALAGCMMTITSCTTKAARLLLNARRRRRLRLQYAQQNCSCRGSNCTSGSGISSGGSSSSSSASSSRLFGPEGRAGQEDQKPQQEGGWQA